MLSRMKRDAKIDLLQLFRTANIGPITCRLMLQRYGSAAKALAAIPELSRRGGRQLKPADRQRAMDELDQLEEQGGQLLCLGSDDYPEVLTHFDDAPPVLSVLGHASLLQQKMLAIVGARNASLNACKMTEKYSAELGMADFVIVSGMARGIDRAAHQGGLVSGTVAVLAGGVDVIYPPENKDIYKELTQSVCVISEMPLATKPAPRLFPVRNRIIASLARGCLVMEAAERSGSLITAREALGRGAEVMAIPGSPMDPRATGCNSLISQGTAHLVQGVDDILTILQENSGYEPDRPLGPFSIVSEAAASDENEVKKAPNCLLENLSYDPISVDELIRWCHVSAMAMAAALLELELAGRVQRHHGSRVSLKIDFE